MKITHILDTFGGGGKERRCLQLIQGLNKAGYNDIQIILINKGIAYKELHECNCQIIEIDRKGKGLGFIATIKELKKHINSFSPDIVQVWGMMSAFFTNIAFPFHKFKFIASYVADVMPPKFPSLPWLTNQLCKMRCCGIIGNSNAGIEAYCIPKRKAKLIYNGFNEKRYETIANKDNKKEELDITTKYIVAQIATFYPVKDWQCFIDSAKIVTSKRKDITFLCVGTGPQWDFFNNQIEENERGFIKLTGRRNDIDEILQICDLSVLCTNVNAKEGLSNTIMESMAFGAPVLATAGGGTPEIIDDNENGIIIREQTPQRLAELIESTIDDEILRKKLSMNGKKTIKTKFELESKTKEYIEFYKGILVK